MPRRLRREGGAVWLLDSVTINPNRIALFALILGARSPDCLAPNNATDNEHYGRHRGNRSSPARADPPRFPIRHDRESNPVRHMASLGHRSPLDSGVEHPDSRSAGAPRGSYSNGPFALTLLIAKSTYHVLLTKRE